MKTIDVSFDVTEDELAVLAAGKCDKPNPERLKQTLMAAAIKNIIHDEGCPSPLSCKKRPRCQDGCEQPPPLVARLTAGL